MRPLPRPSLCLNIPKTGSSFTSRFLDAADWLQFRRRCGLTRLAAPNRTGIEIVRGIKRHGPAWGNLGCRSGDHHAGYASLPPGLRRHPKLCALRDVRTWYCSYYTTAMTDTLLSRAIRMLVGGDARAVRKRRDRLERLSPAFLVWFTRSVRLQVLMNARVGMDRMPDWPMGLRTLRAITILFEDPGKVLRMRTDEVEAYFASGRYLRDLRCDLFLDFDRLTEQLCRAMVGEFGYAPQIVAFLKKNLGRVNVSPDRRRAGVLSELDTGGWFAETLQDEAIYRDYLLPLAGSRLAVPDREAVSGTANPPRRTGRSGGG